MSYYVSKDDNGDYLMHYGVKGMKWGRHKRGIIDMRPMIRKVGSLVGDSKMGSGASSGQDYMDGRKAYYNKLLSTNKGQKDLYAIPGTKGFPTKELVAIAELIENKDPEEYQKKRAEYIAKSKSFITERGATYKVNPKHQTSEYRKGTSKQAVTERNAVRNAQKVSQRQKTINKTKRSNKKYSKSFQNMLKKRNA